MKIELPILHQVMKNGEVISTETTEEFDLDTSVYSEERWEQHFPGLAAREGLFEYIERIDKAKGVAQRVQVASMLKAIFCFIESPTIKTYKDFAHMFNLAAPDYATRLINTLVESFKAILGASSTKN